MALTIVIIAGNEESMIKECLTSALFADNIILIAANSHDNTQKIAKSICPKIKTIKVDDEYGRNFSKWHNIGLKATTTSWIYYLDADERITPELKDEIIYTTESGKSDYYVNPRQNYYLGKKVKYGGSSPDYVKRLYQKNKLEKWIGILHEEPVISGQFGYLKHPLLHFTHRTLTSMLQKSIIWTDMEARALYNNNHPPVVWWRIIRMMFTTFFNRLIKQQMWRDGTVGIISVIYESFDTFIIYGRLWEIQNND